VRRSERLSEISSLEATKRREFTSSRSPPSTLAFRQLAHDRRIADWIAQLIGPDIQPYYLVPAP